MLRTLFSVIAVVLVGAMAFLLYNNNVGEVKTKVDSAVNATGSPPPDPAPLPPVQPVVRAEPVPPPPLEPAPVAPLPVVEKKVVQEPVRRTHVVQPGDTLSGISRKYYNTPDYYANIASHNNIKASDRIRVRQVLLLPDLPVMPEKEMSAEEHVETVNVGNQDFEPQPPTLNITVPKR